MLCYVPFVGWIAAVVVLASPRFQRERRVRFHAFQGIYLFVAWLIVDWVLAPMFRHIPSAPGVHALAGLLQLAVLVAWVFMNVKSSQEEEFHLPILGELAERSVAEQR